MSRPFASPRRRARIVPDLRDLALDEFCDTSAVRRQMGARRAGARALALPLPLPPSSLQARQLLLESLLTRVGPPNAQSFDVELELERTLGLPAERQRVLTPVPLQQAKLLIELSQLGLVSYSGEVGGSLAVVTHGRWRSSAWQRRALQVLSPAVRDAGLCAALIAAPSRWLWKLEQCLPAGWLALLYATGPQSDAAPHDPHGALAAADEHAPPGPWRAAAHLDGRPVAWAPATHDSLLLHPGRKLGLAAMGSRAGDCSRTCSLPRFPCWVAFTQTMP